MTADLKEIRRSSAPFSSRASRWKWAALPVLAGRLLGEAIFFWEAPNAARERLLPLAFGLLSVLLLLVCWMVLAHHQVTHEFERSLDWLRAFQSTLSAIHSPLNAETVRPLGEHLVRFYGRPLGWVLFLKVPGALLRGEVMRRQYLEILSAPPDWDTAEVERLLRDPLDRGKLEVKEVRRDPHNRHNAILLRVHPSSQTDTGIGLAVLLPRRALRFHSGVTEGVFEHALQAVFLHLDLLTVDLLRRREQLGEEGLTWMVRVLVHELSRELQIALSALAEGKQRYARYDGELGIFYDLSSSLTRAAFWVYLFGDLPYGRDGIPLTTRAVPLEEMVEDCMRMTSRSWPEAILSLHASPSGGLKVVADNRLSSVLHNLLFNAASFAPHGRVLVTIRPSGNQVSVLVEDSGPGLTVDQAETVFRLGVSLDNPERTRGMGVGLYLSREIARAYGGDLRCHPNDSEHHGGRFELLLPRVEEVAP